MTTRTRSAAPDRSLGARGRSTRILHAWRRAADRQVRRANLAGDDPDRGPGRLNQQARRLTRRLASAWYRNLTTEAPTPPRRPQP